MSSKQAINLALVTVAVMFAANQLAAVSPAARQFLKGTPVAMVGPSAGSGSVLV